LEFRDRAGGVNWLPLLKWPDWQDHPCVFILATLSTSIEAWQPLQRPAGLSLANTLSLAGGHVCIAHYRYGSTVVKLTPLL
jgi:hypothetical protein